MPNSDNESEASEAVSYKSTSTAHDTSCDYCHEVEKRFSDDNRDKIPNVFIVHLERNVILGRKSQNKTRILQEIEKRVAALRNTEGGKLLIHVEGQNTDRYLEYLDEFIHQSLEWLIGDGTLYTDSYNREWLSDTSGYEEYYDVVLIDVEKARRVSTVDFHSLVRKGHENKKPTTENIIAILSKGVSTPQDPKSVDINSESLQESRYVEFKAFTPVARHRLETVDDIVKYIWSSLKLKENITSISKVEGGGSYFVGISEKEDKDNRYKTKKTEKCGFQLLSVDRKKLYDSLQEKIKKNFCTLQCREFRQPSDDFVKLKLHTLDSSKPEQVLLEVVISYVNGIVFSDVEGPRTYKINCHGEIVRMEKTEWLETVMLSTSRQEE